MEKYLNEIQDLLNRGLLKEAYALCIRVIQASPDYAPAIRLKLKIEKAISKKNDSIVIEKLKSLQPLRNKGELENFINSLQNLYSLFPGNQRIKDQLIQAQEEYRQAQIEKLETFISETTKEIKELASKKDFPTALQREAQIKAYLPDHPKAQRLIQKIHRKYAKYLLKEKQALLSSSMYKEGLEFLYQVQAIDPSYGKTQRLIAKIKSRYYSEQLNQEREYIFKGLENTKTLYQKGKYDKAIKASKEILIFDKNNKKAKKFLRLSQSKLDQAMTEEIAQQIKKNYFTFKPLFENKKGSTVVID